MGDTMKKKKIIKIFSAVISLLMLCGSLSPFTVNAGSENSYAKGLQMFFDDGYHDQLVDCADAVYMEYAELLRTDGVAVHTMHLLGLIYGGLFHNDKIEPDKELYKQALLNIIRTYEGENAEAITQQNLLDDTKSLEDYLHDVADIGLSWLGAVDTNIKLETGEGVIPEDVSLAVSIINQIPKDAEDWAKGACTLKTTLQLYEKHDIFLRTVEENAEGTLKEAASELRIDQSKVVKAHLCAYGDLAMDSAEDYAKLFVNGIWAEDWIDYIKDKLPFTIPKVFSRAFQGVTLGVEIGKLVGNLSVGAEDVMAYIVEIKAVHDISVVLENELDCIMGALQKSNSNVTESDVRNYIAYGNYLISSRIRGQYCMTAIYLQPGLRNLLLGDADKNAEALYNRLTNNLLNIKKRLDEIIDSGISAASTIVDAVNYEKDVVVHPPLVDVWEPQGIKHQIKIPKVSLNTASAQKFNQKIYNNHCYGYELLLLNQEAHMIFDCTYEYKVYKGVVAIAILDGLMVQAGGGGCSYKVYYYSLNEDRELTFDEYLDALGVKYGTVVSRIMNTDAYKDAMQDAWEPIINMTDCLLDENSTSAFFEDIATMDGWSEIKTTSVLNKVESTYSLILNDINADTIQYYNCATSGNFAVIERDGKYGIIGYDGKIILPIEYDSISRGAGYGYDYLIVGKYLDDYYQSEWSGYVDKNGQLQEGYPNGGDVCPSAYWYGERVVIFNADFDIMELDEFLNDEWYSGLKTPGLVLNFREWNSDKIFPVQKISGYTNHGGYYHEPHFDTVQFALMDMSTHKLISDFIYENIDDYNGFSEGLFAVKKNGKWGFVNESGAVVIDFLYDPYESFTYDEETFEFIYTSVNGYISVLRNGKWGLIDTQGNIVVETIYDGISQVNPDGMFWLKENGRWSLYKIDN